MNADPLACTCPACRRYEQARAEHERAFRALHPRRDGHGERSLSAPGTANELRRAAAQMDRAHARDLPESPIGRPSEAPSEAPRAHRTGTGARDVVATNPNNRKEPKP